MNEKKKIVWSLIDDIINNGFDGNEKRVYDILNMFYNEHIFNASDGIIELCLLCSLYNITDNNILSILSDCSMLVMAHRYDDYIFSKESKASNPYSVFSRHIFD